MKINREDVAVIGLSGRFPGAANVTEFWDGLCAGRDAIRAFDDQALRAAGVAEAELADPEYVKAGAPLDGVELFDAGLFKVSPLEAELMDPQIRLLLQCAWETLEDAGYGGREPRRVGVFAGAGGVGTSYFSQYVNRHARFEKITASPTHLGNDKDFLATYLSYKLNLTGPSMTVQTACSTSLVALHQARLSLLAGECDMALAGGVSVRVPNGHGYRYKDGYIFSRGGRVRSFDAGADGVVFGSGMGLVLIKRLSDALRDGDPVRAVIKGSAIGNDGKGKMSYAASSARGQIACIRAALADAGVDAASIGLVEAHGTGTAMGDPEEVKALSAAFREDTDAKGYCALGAVKANIGHLEAAAGIVGFIKAALAVERGTIPPLLHFRQANPRIKFEATPFFVNTQSQPWRQKAPRRAAVNSLGVGGTNAFVVLEQAPARKPAARRRAGAPPALVPISARSEDSLREYAARLAEFIARAQADKTPPDLAELACTLQTGRETLQQRAVFAVTSLAQLRERLEAFGAGGASDAIEALPAPAAQWLADGTADWDALYPQGRPRRIGLPTYVFARERHWIDDVPATAARAMLHPLLHANTSDLAEVRYSSLFHGDEFFLRDHRVRAGAGAGTGADAATPVLPGVAYLEMARAALQQAGAGRAAGTDSDTGTATQALELRDVVWLQAAAVTGERRLDLALIAHDDGRVDFEVYGEPDSIHCQGRAVALADGDAQAPHLDLDAARSASAQRGWDHDAVYAAFAAMGLDYGPAHRPIVELQRGGDDVLARLRLPASLEAEAGQFGLHPSLLDGALQAATWLLIDPDDAPERALVPFALASLRQYAALPREVYVAARRVAGEGGALDLDLCDADGAVCASLRGFVARPFGKSAHASLRAVRVWQDAPAQAAPAREAVRTLICGLPRIDPARIEPRALTLALDADTDAAARYSALARHCLSELKAVLGARPQAEAAFQVVVPDQAEDALLLGLSGLLLSAAAENPRLRAQLIAVDPAIGPQELAAALRRERESAHEPLLRLRAGRREAARWELLPEPADHGADAGLAFKHGGTYLITGGLGGLGLIFARDLLRRCPGVRVLLAGRASAEAVRESPRQAALDALRGDGLAVEYVELDLDDAAALRARLHALAQRHGRIDGILHSAGAIADGLIVHKPLEALDAVLAPKVRGTLNLDAASADLDLDFLALFSSLSAALGNPGQADYAAANGFLDEFAGYRNRLVAAGERRGHTLAIAWPYWRDGGMRLDADGEAALAASTGVRALRSATGLRLFHRSLREGRERVLVMDGDLARMRGALGLDAASAPRAGAAAAAAAAAPAGDLHALAQRLLCERMSGLLKLPAQRLDPAAPLEDYGIDSILALDLTRLLEASFGALPRTLFFEYLSIGELAGYFAREHADTLRRLDGDGPAEASAVAGDAIPAVTANEAAPRATTAAASLRRPARRAAAQAATDARYHDEPIAIVGLSGRYPQARDLEGFWRNLRDGRDCIEEVPASRWDWRDYYSQDRDVPGRHYSKWGGFIEGVDEFDARFFNIAPIEAELLDPQERLFLEQAWMAIEDAGLTRAALRIPAGPGRAAQELPAQVGVYAGVMYGEYQLIGAENSLRGKRMGFASNPASVANRVSYALNLHGPSMTVDTMCSSSLSAIHLACQDLKLGRTDAAIAGGVNVTIHPNKYLMLSAGQFISGDGHCQSFGEGGDGYIPGEGVGAVVLKRLSDAQRDGNRIYGLIRGSALSHGGKTNGYTVPNPQAQASAIRQALRESGLPARRIGYLEAHGTGTKLGDPIEIAALTKVFRESSADSGFCLIGSAKSNIGHCEAAAGVAGLTKVLLQLQHGQIVPSLHSARLNPHIDFAATPFVVNQTLREWPAPQAEGRALPRVAGISSFGAGGSNAHLIVEEYLAPAPAPVAETAQMLPLSARTVEQLRRKAADLLAWLEQPGREVTLADLAHTLQVGREAMDERLAVVADSVAQLRERLRAWLDGDERDVHRGQAKASRERLAEAVQGLDLGAALAQWRERGESAEPLRLWALGLELDWRALRPREAGPGRILALPAYPFARQRHWIDSVATKKTTWRADALHPLLHSNESGIERCAYAARFDGDEFFLGRGGALSEAACLEMARAAVAHALAPPRAGLALELRDLAWSQPRQAPADGRYRISLFEAQGDRVRFEIHSGEQADEAVHCQGTAVYVESPSRSDELSASAAELALPAALADSAGDYVLHPALLEAALAAVSTQPPLRLDALNVLGAAASPSRLALRARAGEPQAFDLDLCAADGRVWAQLRGLRFAAEALRFETDAAAPPPAVAVKSEPRRIAFAAAPGSAVTGGSAPAGLDKPQAIALAPIHAAAAWPASAIAKPRVSLDRAPEAAPASTSPAANEDIALFDEGQGVFALHLHGHRGFDSETAATLARALGAAAAEPALKTLRVSCAPGALAGGDAAVHAAALEAGLYRAAAEFPYPLIVALRGDADGAGLLFAALADVLVCAESGRYALASSERGLPPQCARELARLRFGRALADDLLLRPQGALGSELARIGWTCAVLAADAVDAHARAVAGDLAAKSAAALRLLKQELAAPLRDAASRLAPVAEGLLETDSHLDAVPASALAAALPAGGEGLRAFVLDRDLLGLEVSAQAGAAWADEVRRILVTLGAQSPWRGIVLTCADALPAPAGEGDAFACLRDLGETLAALDRPVVAALPAGADGAAWLAALLCDDAVYAQQARYAADGLFDQAALASPALHAFARRFGEAPARRLLLGGVRLDGATLAREAQAVRAVPAGEVVDAAARRVRELASWPRALWAEWKRADLAPFAAAGPAVDADEPGSAVIEPSVAEQSAPASIVIDSPAISARWHADGVLELSMHDRESRNLFTPEFSRGLRAAFAHAESPACRAVVLTGFERYFAAGGTRETLLAIHQGRSRFTDDKVFELPLRCPVPVVAAMQGHAVGAGWALGMYADVALFSGESRYFSPYMGYGFTPGAGSTLLFAERIGRDLARESLLSAREYAGDELIARGLRQPLAARAHNPAEAMALAARIARLPRARLVALKREWNRALEAGLEQAYAHELAMHERTFVGQAETLALIQRSFAAPAETAAPVAAAPAQAQAAGASQVALGEVVAELRRSLAHELRLPEEEIGEDEEFVALGLDSITGVTWIRRINERYGTAIEAIQVYSHPTLQRLARHVHSLAAAAPVQAAPTVVPAAMPAAAGNQRDMTAEVAATLRRLLAEELRMDEHEIGADEPFVDLGLDSITGVTWVRRINERYGTAIEAVQVYSHPTLARLSAFVAARAPVAEAATQAAPERPAQAATAASIASAEPARIALAAQRHRSRRGAAASTDAIAVIGMAGQFAMARDLEQFWDNLAQARDCIAQVPAQRWDLARYYQPGEATPGKTNSPWLGALEDYDRFDPAFFNISPREARSMDPQQRLFLQACWHGIEHAGYDPKTLAGSNCGVFVGCAAGDYHQLSRRERLSGQGFTGAAPSILAARISYFLDLHGPSLAVDTACSSSLVALANACDSLASGATDLALAGGVNVMAGPAMHIMTAQVGMLGAGGRCRTFDAAADGIALGEGVGVVVLKRLADAERDGDCIHGVIEAWGVNQDGRSNGITAPNADAQARLQGEVYRRFGVDPAGIQLIEAHGTGTALGDPIEVAALKTAFAAHTARQGYCALGSVKSNIGHCLSAAGVSGLLKLLLALRHRQLPPTLHFSRLNPHIALDGSPFYVNDRLRDWDVGAGERRRAAINAFGFSGTNAHAVLAEYRPRPGAAPARATVLAPLSAASPEQLRHKARELLARVEAGVEDLGSLAYTLQVGREAMSERAAVVAADAAALARGLRALAESEDPATLRAAGVARGRAGADQDTLAAFAAEADFQRMLERWIDGGEWARLGELWVKGLALDWRRFHGAGAPRRMALPLHPFARERYWIEADEDAMPAAVAAPVAIARPGEVAVAPVASATAAAVAATVASASHGDAAALQRLQAQLRDSLAEALFMRAAEIGLDKPFNELGLDSIVGVEWVKGLNQQLGCELSATRIYDYPSVRALAAYLQTVLAPSPGTAAAPAAPAVAASAPIAAQVVAPAALREELRESLAEALFMRPAEIGWNKSFSELGLDSIVGVEWVKAINRRYGTALSATRVYDYPSIEALATYLAAQIGAGSAPSAAAPVAAFAAAAPATPAVAPQAAATPAAAAPALSLDELQRELRDSLAEALYMRPEDIGPDKSFTELGLDSIVGVEWMKRVNQRFGTQIAALRVYDYPSLRSLAAHLLEQLPAAPAPVAALRAGAASRFGERLEATRFEPAGFEPAIFLPLAVPAPPVSGYFGAGERSGDFAVDGELSLLYRIAPEGNVGLREHVVFGRHVLPTDAYVELLLAAFAEHFGEAAVALRELSLANPLLGEPGRERRLRLTFRRHRDGLQCFVRSSGDAGGDDETLHLSGLLVPADGAAPASSRREFAVERRLQAEQIATNAGLFYAPLQELAFGADAALGRIRVAAHAGRFHADPFAIYGALCTAINAAGFLAAQRYGAHDDQFLPHRIGRIAVFANAVESGDLHGHAELRQAGSDALEFDVELSDAAGRVRARLEGLVLRRVGRAALQRREVAASAPPAPALPATPQPAARTVAAGGPRHADKIAIVGMSCRFPQSEDLDAFWDNLAHGRDCIGEIPPQRWAGQGEWFHPDPRHPRTSYSKWAGLLDDIAAFDPLFFGISPAEAELIDPQQRIFLEQCWKAIEHAGYAPGALSGQACGVYVGCAAGDYARVLGAAGQDGAGAAFMGTSSAILAARIAYFLNLKGAALAVDTACSSSLVALHLACESIRSGENRWALCGGINLLTTPIGHVLTSQVGMPSRDGRCAAFDASAGGIVFSEGCGVVLLKSLAQAEADNDRILGVIEASGINQDGKTNGITAPSAQAQEQLLGQVYARYGVDPARIGYVEAHGTATALGDPIEVDALSTVFGRAGAAAGGCALGSVKSNIGHTGFAAGVAGVIKVLLCLQRRELVPTVHYREANPHIRFEDSPFYVNTQRRDWRSEQRRLATVSSFGFSGTNAHVVIGEHVAVEEAASATGPVLLPLSARSAAQLRAKAADLLAWLRREPAVDLRRLAYTLQIGRDPMEHRLGCIAADLDQACAQLQGYLDGQPRVPGLQHGRADGEDRTLAVFAADEDMRAVFEQWLERGQLPKLQELWVRGLDIDWRRLHRGRAPRRLSLPDYPFAREHCWVQPAERGAMQGTSGAAQARLHPLLHRNTSDLSLQSYRSGFDGSEFFLADHRVRGRRVLPAVAQLEMARAAFADALPLGEGGALLELRHVAWAQPLAVDGPCEVGVAVYAEDDGALGFEIYSHDPQADDEILHCQGRGAAIVEAAPAPLDLAALRARLSGGRSEAAALYPHLAGKGLEYGPAFQGVVAIELGDGETLAELRLPETAGGEGYVLHPSLLDSALQASIPLIEAAAGGATALPFALESLRAFAPCLPRMQAWVRYAPDSGQGGLVKVDIDLCGDDGAVRVQMRGFASRALPARASADTDTNTELNAAHAVELG